MIVVPARHPKRPEHQSLKLLRREHPRREQKSGFQNLANTGLALNRCALSLQAGDIAIKRAKAYIHAVRERFTAHRLTMTAQHVQQIKKAFGAGHIMDLITINY